MSDERASQDESRRELERALTEAAPGEERAAARLRFARSERRRGQPDVAAFQLEEALREGAERQAAGNELAALLAEDVGDPGARRALACFSALHAPGSGAGPFASLTRIGLSSQLRVELFQATFRALPRERVLALAGSVVAISPGGSVAPPSAGWTAFLARGVDDEEERALSELYGRLLGAARRRITRRLDDPGPIHEAAAQRCPIDGDGFAVSFAGDEQLYSLRRSGGKLLLRGNRLIGLQMVVDECEVFAGLEVTAPRLVGSAGGAFVVGVDEEGVLHASLSSGQGELLKGERRVGRGVSVVAACECAAGLAVFLDAGARAVIFGRDGRFSREKRLLEGREVVSAASHGGADVFVLLRGTTSCELLRLDAALRALGEPIPVPYVRVPRDAHVAWMTPDLVLVVDAPDVVHAFGADDRKLAWTARLADPLHDIEPAISEALELVAYGPIEGEWGQDEGDIGVARWTRDGVGRHGPTVRLETVPDAPIGSVRLATRGNLLAVAYREGEELVQRLLVLVRTEVKSPAPAEWTFRGGESGEEETGDEDVPEL